MAKNIKLELSSNNDDIYFDSILIVNGLLKEMNIYPSSQKRLTMSKYLFALYLDEEQIGFITAFIDDKYYRDVLSLDFCLLPQYRDMGIANKILPQAVEVIEQSSNYDNEYLILEKTRSHDKDVDGIKYNDNIILLQDRLDEMNYDHPDGIEKTKRVIYSKEAFITGNKGRKQ